MSNAKEALAVAPVSKTKLEPSPTIKPPLVTAKPATSANCASYACTSLPIATPREVLAVAPFSATNVEPLPTIILPSVTAKPAIAASPAS